MYMIDFDVINWIIFNDSVTIWTGQVAMNRNEQVLNVGKYKRMMCDKEINSM